MPKKWVYWMEELGKEHNLLVGRKCAHLGEMTKMGLNIPQGFALSVDAYSDFMRDTGALTDIMKLINTSLRNSYDITELTDLSTKIRRIVEDKPLPGEMQKKIIASYYELCLKCNKPEIAVSTRSAGPVSRPGQYETFLNVKGERDVIEYIKKVWASSFNPRSLAFRHQKGLPLESDPIGVAVIRMIRAKAAGVSFTADPNTGDTSRINIEANWGLGESVVNGQSTPDLFIIDKTIMEIADKQLGPKTQCITCSDVGVVEKQVAADKVNSFCISDEEAKAIGRLSKKLEDHFGVPQDIEWAIEENALLPDSLFLLQTRAEVIAQTKAPVDQIIDLMLGHFSSGSFGDSQSIH